MSLMKSVMMNSSKIIQLGQKITSSASLAAESLSAGIEEIFEKNIDNDNDIIAGNVIAVPTDTIYGITCLVQHSQAVNRLYSIKGRSASKPIAICVAEVDEIYRWANVTVSKDLIEDLLPGQVRYHQDVKTKLDLNSIMSQFKTLGLKF